MSREKITKIYFCRIRKSFQVIFWSVFGTEDYYVTRLDVFRAEFTELIGTMLFAFYHLIVVLVFMNMLIALMTKSMEAVEVSLVKQWHFFLADIFAENRYLTIPIDFNIKMFEKKSIAYDVFLFVLTLFEITCILVPSKQ